MLDRFPKSTTWGSFARVVRSAASLLALVLVFVLAAAFGFVIHLDTNPTRRLAARLTNSLVSAELVAELSIEKIEVLSAERLIVSRASLLDEFGKPVLVAEHLDVRFGLFALLRGILGKKEIRVTIPDVRAEKVFVGLRRDEKTGDLSIENAFRPASPGPPGGAKKPVFVALSRITVVEASLATNLPGIEQARVRVLALTAGLSASPAGFVLSLNSDDARISELLQREVKGRLRSEIRLKQTTHGELDARAGAVPLKATVTWRGTQLGFGLSSPELGPAAMSDLFPGWPLIIPLQGSATATGSPERLATQGEGRGGATRITASGSLVFSPEVASDFVAHVRALDLRAFAAGAPVTAFDVDGKVSIRFEGGVSLDATATVAETELSGYRVPAFAIRSRYAHDVLTATATVLDPKLATTLELELLPDGRLEFEAKSEDLDLEALARYGVNARGHATFRSHGVLVQGRLVANADASLRAVRAGPLGVNAVSLQALVEGALAEPRELLVEIEGDGTTLEVVGARLDRFRIESKGTGARQLASFRGSSKQGSKLDVSARLELGEALVWSEPRVDLTLVAFDVEPVLGALGRADWGVKGRIDGHVRFEEQSGGKRFGKTELELRDGTFPRLGAVTCGLTAELDGADLEAHARLAVGKLGSAKLEATGSLQRPIFDARAVTELTGRAAFELIELDLERASRQWLGDLGIKMQGHARGKLVVARTEPRSVPRVAYDLATRDLAVSRTHGSLGPLSDVRVDVESTGELLGPKGSHVALRLVDADGPWIDADVEHSLGGEAFARAFAGEWKHAVLEAPLRARVVASPRPVSMLGSAGPAALDGTVSAALGVIGSARTPEIAASAAFVGAAEKAAGPLARLDAVLQYSAKSERYALEAKSGAGRDRIELGSTGRFGWLDRGFGRDWSARGEARVTRLGLAPLGRLVNTHIDGELSCHSAFDLDGEHLDMTGELSLDRLSVGGVALGNGSGRLKVADGRVQASLDVSEGKSKLAMAADAGLVVGQGGLVLDRRQVGTLRASASDFELASLGPLVRGVASRISGKLNGRVELDWASSGTPEERPAATLSANATVSNGTASLAVGGGLIQKVEMRAVSEGSGVVRFTFRGAARSRKHNLRGTAVLHLEGPRLKRFDTRIEAEAFPLLLDGVLMGRATTGSGAPLEVSITPTERGQMVDIFLPAVDVVLPKSSSQSLIELDDDPRIEIEDAPIEPKEQARTAREPGSTTLRVRLGKLIRIKRGALDVPVGGAITVHPDGRLSGSIELPQGGVVPAAGQLFRIRRGVVKFENQEAKDGTLAIQAWTRAEDGTLVDIDVSGTIREPVVSFHSDPPRSEAEIVAVLLGVQIDQQADKEGEQLGRSAMALAMNRLLRDSPLSGLQFRAGETGRGEAVSTVTMRVGNKVWLEGRTVRGTEYSVNPDERVSGVVDWRFAPSWSFRTQLGEVSGVELRWSLRY